MNIYVLLSKLFPESSVKDKLRILLYTYFENDALVGYNKKYKLQAGDIVVDAGAFPGEYSLYASKRVGKTGKVICFEPNPQNYAALKRVTRKETNIIIINKGLWKEDGQLNITENNQGATITDNGNDPVIIVTSLDVQLKKLGLEKVNFIKMDIEGAEIEALDGMINTLRQPDTNLAIASYHIVNGEKTCYIVEKKLTNFGYMVTTGHMKHLTTYASNSKSAKY